MSFFQKSKIDLKKYYIIHSSASACAISAGLPLCFSILFLVIRGCEHYAADCIFADGWRKRWSRKLGGRFARFLVGRFRGMFWIFAAMGIRFMSQKWGFLFWPFFPIFLALFLGIFCIFCFDMFYKICPFLSACCFMIFIYYELTDKSNC